MNTKQNEDVEEPKLIKIDREMIEILKTIPIPGSNIDMHLGDYSRFILNILDIPIGLFVNEISILDIPIKENNN